MTSPMPRESGFKSFGDFLLTVANADRRPHASLDPRLLQARAAAGGSEQVPSDGGFLVYPEFAKDLMMKTYSTGLFLSKCDQYPITQDNAGGVKIPGYDEQSRADGSRFGGVRSYWANEADAETKSKPKFNLIDLELKKLLAFIYATDEMLIDAALLGAAVEKALVAEMQFKAEYAAFFGTGSGQPLGMINSPALITIAKEAGQTAGTVVYNNIIKMNAQFWVPSRRRAMWFIHPDVEQQLAALTVSVGTAGSELPLFQYTSANQFNLLMGRPVVPIEYMPALGQLGDIVLCDPFEYIFADKDGITSDVSLHVNFLTDESVFRFRWRVDGQPKWATQMTPFQGGAKQSPYVTLAAR